MLNDTKIFETIFEIKLNMMLIQKKKIIRYLIIILYYNDLLKCT